MKNTTLHPITTPHQTTNLTDLKYLPGFPRRYRFDAKAGRFSLKGEEVLTDRGQPFAFIPIGFRIFTAEIMGYPRRKWAELFFLNQAGQVGNVLFHGYSVDQLQRLLGEMYYDEVSLTEVLLTVTPEPRSNQHGTYYVAAFRYQPLTDQERLQLEAVTNALPPLYRQETLTGDEELHAWQHVFLPEADEERVLAAEESTDPPLLEADPETPAETR